MNYEDRTSLIQAGHAPPKLLIERRENGQVLCLRLSGTVDEQFDGVGLARTIRARWLVLDLGGIDRISSFGIRQWIDFIGATAGRVEAARHAGADRLRLERLRDACHHLRAHCHAILGVGSPDR